MQSQGKVKQITAMAMLFALAMVLSVVESAIPPIVGLIPGIKLGLSNIVVMYTLFLMSLPYALGLAGLKAVFVLLLRGVLSFALSFGGGCMSILVMWAALQMGKEKLSYVMVSVLGSITHNMVQLGLAVWFTGSPLLVTYLPVLLLSGVGMGIITGTITKTVLPLMKKING